MKNFFLQIFSSENVKRIKKKNHYNGIWTELKHKTFKHN